MVMIVTVMMMCCSPLTEQLSCARHYIKHFISSFSLNHSSNPDKSYHPLFIANETKNSYELSKWLSQNSNAYNLTSEPEPLNSFLYCP